MMVYRAVRIPVASDLSDISLEEALHLYKKHFHHDATTLMAGNNDALYAGIMHEKFGLQIILLPDEMLSDPDWWAIVGDWGCVYSPGDGSIAPQT